MEALVVPVCIVISLLILACVVACFWPKEEISREERERRWREWEAKKWSDPHAQPPPRCYGARKKAGDGIFPRRSSGGGGPPINYGGG